MLTQEKKTSYSGGMEGVVWSAYDKLEVGRIELAVGVEKGQ
jgi:hypothetical protein